jgi:hypothetical protein
MYAGYLFPVIRKTKARAENPTEISEGIQRSNSWPDLSQLLKYRESSVDVY